jgi:hypothetical protein
MKRRISALFVVLWLVSNGFAYAGAQTNQKDEPLIYTAVIEELFAGKKLGDKPIKALLLEGVTRFDDFEGEKAVTPKAAGTPMFKGVKPETMQSFMSQNAQRLPLTNSIKASLKLQLIDSKLAQETVGGNKWQALYAANPDSAGIISVSRIGFDKAGNQALVYVAHIYGEDQGRGTILFLQKTGQVWKVQEKVSNWVWAG